MDRLSSQISKCEEEIEYLSSPHDKSLMTEKRRREILAKLHSEREERRKHIADGTINEFKLENITSVQSSNLGKSHTQDHHYHPPQYIQQNTHQLNHNQNDQKSHNYHPRPQRSLTPPYYGEQEQCKHNEFKDPTDILVQNYTYNENEGSHEKDFPLGYNQPLHPVPLQPGRDNLKRGSRRDEQNVYSLVTESDLKTYEEEPKDTTLDLSPIKEKRFKLQSKNEDTLQDPTVQMKYFAYTTQSMDDSQERSRSPDGNIRSTQEIKENKENRNFSSNYAMKAGKSIERGQVRENSLEPKPRTALIKPSEKPRKEFTFDTNSRVAKRIQKKYKNLGKEIISEHVDTSLGGGGHNFNLDKCSKHDYPTNFEKQKKKMTLQQHHTAKYMENTVNKDIRLNKEKISSKTKELCQELEQEFKQICTFSPRISKAPLDIEDNAISKEERINRLYMPKTTQLQKWEMEKQRKEEEEFHEHCTFKPEIEESSALMHARSHYNRPAEDRLHHEADLRIASREKAQRIQDKKIMQQCTFHPQLQDTQKPLPKHSSSSSHKPIYARFEDIQKQKAERLQKLRMESEDSNPHLTYKPQINKASELMLKQKTLADNNRITNVTERLTQDAADRIHKSYKSTQQITQQISLNYPFAPNLAASQIQVDLNASAQSNLSTVSNFLDRQQAFIQNQRENKEKKYCQYSQEAQCTFKPRINFTSEVIVEADPDRCKETEAQKFNRLSTKDSKKVEVIKEVLENELYSQYTHKPKINKLSKTLGRNPTIDKLAYNEEGRQKKCALSENIRQQEIGACTFKPLLNDNKNKNVDSNYKPDEALMAKIKQQELERKEHIDQNKRNHEYADMKYCTFQPQVNDKILEGKEDVVIVRGLGRHLELREMQKKKVDEKKEREEKVFGINKKQNKDIEGPFYTIPQPFNLSAGVKNENRWKKTQEEIVNQQMQECTFKPNTLEAKNKQMLKELIQNKNHNPQNLLA